VNACIVGQLFTMPSITTVSDLFPAFAAELGHLVRVSDRPELADQIPGLPVVTRCMCGQDNCAHFYTAPPPNGAYGAGHANLVLAAETGLVVLDVVDGQIIALEILDRPDVKRLLDAHLPLSP
jgi:hypothetical protein